jgi:hypothetical protein
MSARDYNAALPARDWCIKPLKDQDGEDISLFFSKSEDNPLTVEELEALRSQ